MTHTYDLGKRNIISKHNLIILNPFHAKTFLSVLDKAIKDYETKFGEIKKSESMKRAEKMVKKEQKKVVENKEVKKEKGLYFG